jgi:hypothetical protein
VILCHGYGSDGNDLIGLAPHWQGLLPDAAFVSPNAPERCEMSPMGYQWFGIGNFNEAERLAGARRAAPILNAFIDQELANLGLTDRDLALVGFSGGRATCESVGKDWGSKGDCLPRLAPPHASLAARSTASCWLPAPPAAGQARDSERRTPLGATSSGHFLAGAAAWPSARVTCSRRPGARGAAGVARRGA